MSLIWNFFKKSAGTAYCKHCDYQKDYPPRTSSNFLRTHLQTKHAELFLQLQKEEKDKTDKDAKIIGGNLLKRAFANAATTEEAGGKKMAIDQEQPKIELSLQAIRK
jgi:hypothetical protein